MAFVYLTMLILPSLILPLMLGTIPTRIYRIEEKPASEESEAQVEDTEDFGEDLEEEKKE